MTLGLLDVTVVTLNINKNIQAGYEKSADSTLESQDS